MAALIIWFVTMFGCAALFYALGVYAKHLKKPMWFWSGSTIDPDSITDIPKYNLANSRMWKAYSLFFWAAGALFPVNEMAAIVVMFIGFLPGLPVLVFVYTKIEKKYKEKK